MTARPRNSTRARRICFETWRRTDEAGRIYMDCQCGQGLRKSCGLRIYVKEIASSAWRADHGITKWAEGGEDTADNLFPVLEKCDREFKAPEDVKTIAKNKRIKDRQHGLKISSRPMPGSKASGWKKTFSRGWVRR